MLKQTCLCLDGLLGKEWLALREAFKIESLKAKEQLEIFDPLAAKGNAEVLCQLRSIGHGMSRA